MGLIRRSQDENNGYCIQVAKENLENTDIDVENLKNDDFNHLQVDKPEHVQPFVQTEDRTMAYSHYWANRIDRSAIIVLPSVYVVIVSVYWISYLSR